MPTLFIFTKHQIVTTSLPRRGTYYIFNIIGLRSQNKLQTG